MDLDLYQLLTCLEVEHLDMHILRARSDPRLWQLDDPPDVTTVRLEGVQFLEGVEVPNRDHATRLLDTHHQVQFLLDGGSAEGSDITILLQHLHPLQLRKFHQVDMVQVRCVDQQVLIQLANRFDL